MIRIAYMEISIGKRRPVRGHLRVKVPWSGTRYITPKKAALLRAFLDEHFPAATKPPACWVLLRQSGNYTDIRMDEPAEKVGLYGRWIPLQEAPAKEGGDRG